MNKRKTKKRKVVLCWWCGNKLRGRHFVKMKYELATTNTVMHKACSKLSFVADPGLWKKVSAHG